jgi:calcineurin-like phosphoesterase family protein
VEEMNEVMIEKWNNRVNKNDLVYHIGDVGFFKSAQQMQDTMSLLNGRKILIKGNHDRFTNTQYRQAGFEDIHDELMLEIIDRAGAGQKFLLTHKPEVLYTGPGYVLCGHIHQQFYYQGNNLNMSVEVWGYQPVTMEEINQRIDWLRENVYDTNTKMSLFAKESNFGESICPPIPSI